MNRLNRMTIGQMSAVSGVPVDVVQRRVTEKKPRAYSSLTGGDKEYKVLFDYIRPHHDKNGLVSASYLGKMLHLSRDTTRKRLLKNFDPDYLLEDGRGTYLWKYSDAIRQAVFIEDTRPKIMDVKRAEQIAKRIAQREPQLFDEEGPVVYQGDALRLVEDERMKKQWVGKQGILCNGNRVLAEGTIEHVTSMGVFVNGVKGELWMLELAEEENVWGSTGHGLSKRKP